MLQNLPKIKNQVPKISLSLIEYNKIKVMNEADLYSYNKRQEQRGNEDENTDAIFVGSFTEKECKYLKKPEEREKFEIEVEKY